MHNKVKVTGIEELDGGWLVDVSVDERLHHVGVSRDYYQQLTDGDESIEQLVLRSFEFLLKREPASAIMSRFELSVIKDYFPEYESVISSDGDD